MAEKLPTYSIIISPKEYNQIMTKQHLYIASSDNVIKNCIQKEVKKKHAKEVVEIGCGPGRVLVKTVRIKGINLSAVDHDPTFINYAKELVKGVHFTVSDIKKYKHHKPVDVFYSQGMHHHIERGEDVKLYLKNIYNQLKENGVYIISDEFLPNYDGEEERAIKATVWYAHIIANALKGNFKYLAQEEAKTYLDDLFESGTKKKSKTESQINLVIESVNKINNTAMKDIEEAELLGKRLLEKLKQGKADEETKDKKLKLSRGDYKICDKEFRKTVERVGFKVEEVIRIGPKQDIGALVVYILRK